MIEERHWEIWGLQCCQQYGGETGYPKAVPWYTPALRSDDRLSEWDEIGNVTPEDDRIADAIGKAVLTLWHRGELLLVRGLIARYRASPALRGSTIARAGRVVGLSRQQVYRLSDQGKQVVAGVVTLSADPCK